MDRLNTDDIVEIAKHIENRKDVSAGKFFAEHGLEFEKVKRACHVLVPAGEGRLEAFRSGLLLGLQLGAMRLDPFEWTDEDEERQDPCNCIACQMKRVVEELTSEEDD